MRKLRSVVQIGLELLLALPLVGVAGYFIGGGMGVLVAFAGGFNGGLGAAISGSLFGGIVPGFVVALGASSLGGIFVGVAVALGVVDFSMTSLASTVSKSLVCGVAFWLGYAIGPALKRCISGQPPDCGSADQEVEEEMLRMLREDEDARKPD